MIIKKHLSENLFGGSDHRQRPPRLKANLCGLSVQKYPSESSKKLSGGRAMVRLLCPLNFEICKGRLFDYAALQMH